MLNATFVFLTGQLNRVERKEIYCVELSSARVSILPLKQRQSCRSGTLVLVK